MNDIAISKLSREPVSQLKKKRRRATTAAHDERRLQIIERCAALFNKVGYYGMSMQLLADDIGISKPTLYHYFTSKNDILYEMHQMHIAAMVDGLGELEGVDGSPTEVLERACTNTLREIAEHPGYVSAFMNHYTELEGEQRDAVRKSRQAYFQRIINAVKNGMESGMFRTKDPERVALAFLGMCNWAYTWYPRKAKEHAPEDAAKELLDIFLGGLCRR